jgi:hypothetical protein
LIRAIKRIAVVLCVKATFSRTKNTFKRLNTTKSKIQNASGTLDAVQIQNVRHFGDS